MAEPWDSLRALFPDNDQGLITAQNMRTQVTQLENVDNQNVKIGSQFESQLEATNSGGTLNTINTKGTGPGNVVLNLGELEALLASGVLTSIKVGGPGDEQELMTEADLNALVPALHAYAFWRGNWETGVQYEKNDLVDDMGWLMSCKDITQDRAAPLIMGSLYNEFSPDEEPTFSSPQTHPGLVMFGHEYTVVDEGYLDAVEVRIPVISATTTYYDVYFGYYDSGANLVKSRVHGVKLTSDTWSNIHVPKRYFKAGDKFRIEIWVKDVIATAPRLDDTYELRNFGGDPADGEVSWISDSEIRISKKNKGGADRTAQVTAIAPGDRLLLTSTTLPGELLEFEALEPAVDAGTYVIVTGGRKVAQRGNILATDWHEVNLYNEALTLANVEYYQEIAHTWGSPFATVKGLLYEDGLDQVADADAFGIRTWWQEANASDDWAVVRMPSESYAKSGSLSPA